MPAWSSRRAFLVAALVLIALDVAFLFPALRPGFVRAPGDIILATEPMATPGVPPAANPYLADWPLQFHPWMTMVRRAWSEGRVPLWNDKNGVGQPLLANTQCGAFSPYLPLTLGAGDDAADVQQLAQTILAQIFCLMLARRLSWTAFGGAVLAFAFTYSSYMQSWCMHPHTASAAFTPFIILGMLALRRRPSLLWIGLTGAAVGLSVLSGHLETAVMAGLSATLIAAFHRPDVRDRENGFGRFSGGVVLVALTGLLLAAIVIVPFLEYLALSPVTLLRTLQKGTPLPFENLRTLIDPHALGDAVGPNAYRGAHNAVDGVFFVGRLVLLASMIGIVGGLFRKPLATIGLVLTAALGISVAFAPAALFAIWKTLPVLSHMPLVRFVFVATVPLVLLAAGGADMIFTALARRAKKAAAAFAAIFVGVMVVEGFVQWRTFVPVISHTALHPKSQALEYLSTAGKDDRALPLGHMLPPEMNAAFGVRSFRTYDAVGSERHLLFLHDAQSFYGETWTQAAVFCNPKILDLAGIRWLISKWPAETSPEPTNATVVDAAHPVIRTGPAPAGQTMELFFFRGTKTPVHDGTIRVKVGQKDGAATELTLAKDTPAESRGTYGTFKTNGDAAMRDLIAVNYKDFDVGYVAFTYAEVAGEVTNAIEVLPGGEPVVVYLIARNGLGRGIVERATDGIYRVSERTTALPRVFFTTEVTTVRDFSAALAEYKKASFDPHAGVILESATDLSRTSGTSAQKPTAVAYRSRSPERLEIDVDQTNDGWVVALDLPAPGWRATIDGTTPAKILPADVIGRAVFVPAGKHTVVMEYAPRSLLIGAVLSATTLVLVLGAILFAMVFRPSRAIAPIDEDQR